MNKSKLLYDFTKNAFESYFNKEQDPNRITNREIIRDATDEELQAIADFSKLYRLEDLKKDREKFRAELNETIKTSEELTENLKQK